MIRLVPSSTDASFMTLLSTAQHLARDTRRDPRSHMILIMVAVTITAGAVALVAYLLWPTWMARPASGPGRLPVSVGATLFNVPTAAIRRKIHATPAAERVDLSFVFPRWNRRMRRSTSAPIRSRRRCSRSTGSSVDISPPRRWRRMRGSAHLSALPSRSAATPVVTA